MTTLFPELFCKRRLDASTWPGISASAPGRPCKPCPRPGQLSAMALRGSREVGCSPSGLRRKPRVCVAGTPVGWEGRGHPRQGDTPKGSEDPARRQHGGFLAPVVVELPRARPGAALPPSPICSRARDPGLSGSAAGPTARSPKAASGSTSAPASLRPRRWMSFTVKDPEKTCDFTSGNKNARVHIGANFLTCRNVILLLRLRGSRAGGGERAQLSR